MIYKAPTSIKNQGASQCVVNVPMHAKIGYFSI